jgi:hypothetical protein
MKIKLPGVRLLYGAALFEAQKGPNGEGDPKFSATFGIPNDSPLIAEIKAGFKKVAEEKWGAKAAEVFAMLKAGDKLCLHDGAAKGDREGYAGHQYLSASNKLKPLVCDNAAAPGTTTPRILTATDGRVYSGCFVNATIELWAQDNKFGKRINASLMGVQFARDGARLSGGGVASVDDFEAIPEAAAPVAAGASAPVAAGAAVDPFA